MPYSDPAARAASLIESNRRRYASVKTILAAIVAAGWTVAQFSDAIRTGAVVIPRRTQNTKQGKENAK